MNCAALLADGIGRVQEVVHEVLDDLRPEELGAQLDEGANSIAWLIWHLTRIQDDHVADVAGTEQIWTEQGWRDRFGLPFGAGVTGYGHGARDIAKVRIDSPQLLIGYYDAVHEKSLEFVRDLSGVALDRVVDERWTPPVTLGVRLISVISDDLQHAGQAAFIKGVLRRR